MSMLFQFTTGGGVNNWTATLCQGLSVLHSSPAMWSSYKSGGDPTPKSHLIICFLRSLLAPAVPVWVFQEADPETGTQCKYLFGKEIPGNTDQE